ncbi:hypothetical protein ACFX5U_09340 [Sphingobacterium sp. SG20118]|uniref:hypothetical protein n=1 Tax=Sphingobacterium sp. SG20118 TaxID=3367156 RepID=UPI0037DFC621
MYSWDEMISSHEINQKSINAYPIVNYFKKINVIFIKIIGELLIQYKDLLRNQKHKRQYIIVVKMNSADEIGQQKANFIQYVSNKN